MISVSPHWFQLPRLICAAWQIQVAWLPRVACGGSPSQSESPRWWESPNRLGSESLSWLLEWVLQLGVVNYPPCANCAESLSLSDSRIGQGHSNRLKLGPVALKGALCRKHALSSLSVSFGFVVCQTWTTPAQFSTKGQTALLIQWIIRAL
jgi:hypothetical protein